MEKVAGKSHLHTLKNKHAKDEYLLMLLYILDFSFRTNPFELNELLKVTPIILNNVNISKCKCNVNLMDFTKPLHVHLQNTLKYLKIF